MEKHYPLFTDKFLIKMSETIQLVYVSSATQPFTQSQLVDLLTKSRINNARRGITGMLLYKGGNFIQVLEGQKSNVSELLEIIKADPRHRGTELLLEEKIEHRAFQDWPMGFRNLDDPAILALPGFSQLMNHTLKGVDFKHDPTGCMALINFFRQSR